MIKKSAFQRGKFKVVAATIKRILGRKRGAVFLGGSGYQNLKGENIMDINNYSYAPGMIGNDDYIESYENDDMTADISIGYRWTGESWVKCFYVTAYSYDGSLDVSERFNTLYHARRLYSEIVERYSDTPPDEDELSALIESIHEEEKAA